MSSVAEEEDLKMDKLNTETQTSFTPAQTVEQLDRYIIGQNDAKRPLRLLYVIVGDANS